VQAGKKEYPLPMFVNAWIVQPEDKGPGDYPSGGPQDHMHDIWRAGAPALDMLCPDVYLPNFEEIVDRYSRSGNPLYVPESAGDLRGAANAFYTVGQRHGVGYSQFGIDSLARSAAGPNPPQPGAAPAPVEALPLSVAYETLSQLAPFILEHQSKDTIASVVVNPQKPDQTIRCCATIWGPPPTRVNPAAACACRPGSAPSSESGCIGIASSLRGQSWPWPGARRATDDENRSSVPLLTLTPGGLSRAGGAWTCNGPPYSS
jgi:hypothetical protein